MNLTLVLTLVVIGLMAGILSGFMGVGGGVIMIPLMILLLGYSQHEAQGTSLAVLAIPVTFLAAYNYYDAGHVNWKFAIVMALAFVVGGYLGSKFAISLDQSVLKKIFGIVLLVAAIKLFFDK
ncbi:MAG: permease [Flavobacteriaceae bacterium]|nr:permease [Flavobacteriaceae bacterium]|tara:strand:- start:421 stop:789 length:369 start_codon:yes stop_codon:yes gene_type:complete